MWAKSQSSAMRPCIRAAGAAAVAVTVTVGGSDVGAGMAGAATGRGTRHEPEARLCRPQSIRDDSEFTPTGFPASEGNHAPREPMRPFRPVSEGGDLATYEPTYDRGCDLAIEAVNASHAGAGYLSRVDHQNIAVCEGAVCSSPVGG